ncbi:MAG TPA: class I SAM-dependent methyltransferase [Acidimicrobiales bacterium]|nr:class I SAM-dependent methyltransferase [Acidimicrobiales bacterium]
MSTDPWEVHAGWWRAAFTDGADPEYAEQILPIVAAHLPGAAEVLDLGAGEGHIARLAASPDGAPRRVVGIDAAAAQLDNARASAGGPAYVRADATTLPLRASCFDAAIACLVLEHIEAAEDAIAEVGRVLRAGGRFLVFINHPLTQAPGSGWIDDHILEEQYWRVGRYLVEETTVEEVDKDIKIPFVHRPLSHYVNAMARAGLTIVEMQEPAPPPGFLLEAEEYVEAATIPRLMFIRAEKAS